VLHATMGAQPDRMKRFERESPAASGLNHPNMITTFEIDRSGSTSFIPMECNEASDAARTHARTADVRPSKAPV
jgi:hypothetical protein